MGPIRVLIVDDSAIMRKVIAQSLSSESDIRVIGTAGDATTAREKIQELHPDVLTLDLQMPNEDGLTFLKSLKGLDPVRVVVLSSQLQHSPNTLTEVLGCGAMDVLAKPVNRVGWTEVGTILAQKLRRASNHGSRERRASAPNVESAPLPAQKCSLTRPLIVIGASTGGPEALTELLLGLPAECPPVVITQHMPAHFSRAFAARLDRMCRLVVKEAENGDLILPGRALIAPGGFHLLVRRVGGVLQAVLEDSDPVCFQRPSVDVMFRSVAEAVGSESIGVLLTGMGSDGAEGLQKLRSEGAHTIAQDESSSIVFGMPRAAIRLGAAEKVLPLSAIAPQLTRWFSTFTPAFRTAG